MTQVKGPPCAGAHFKGTLFSGALLKAGHIVIPVLRSGKIPIFAEKVTPHMVLVAVEMADLVL